MFVWKLQTNMGRRKRKCCPKFDKVFKGSDINIYKKIVLISPKCNALKIIDFT